MFLATSMAFRRWKPDTRAVPRAADAPPTTAVAGPRTTSATALANPSAAFLPLLTTVDVSRDTHPPLLADVIPLPRASEAERPTFSAAPEILLAARDTWSVACCSNLEASATTDPDASPTSMFRAMSLLRAGYDDGRYAP